MLYLIILIAVALVAAAYYFVPGFRERVKGWRTVAVGVVTGIVGFLQSFNFAQIIPPDKIGYVLLGLGVLGVILRYVTTSALGKSK